MKLKLVKRPDEATKVVDDDTDEQLAGVTSVQYYDNGVDPPTLEITVVDFAVDVLSDEDILKVVEIQEKYKKPKK